MEYYQLCEDFKLGLEQTGQRHRVILFNTHAELACHLVTATQMRDALDKNIPQLFKGRLQLIRNSDDFAIQFNGKIVGHIPVSWLKNQFLQTISNPD